MATNVSRRDSLVGLLRNDDVRLTYQERLVARANMPTVVVPSEVEISTDDPIGRNSVAELWFDPDAVLPPDPGGGGTVTSEVEIGSTEPTNPDAELWFNPNAPTDPLQSVNEVWIGDTAPTDDAVELWYSPGGVIP